MIDINRVIDEYRAALVAHDIVPPDHIEADGIVHRADSAGKHGKGDAAYMLRVDGGAPFGGFENYQNGGDNWQVWRFNIGRDLTVAEREQQRRDVEKARTERAVAAEKRYGAAALEATVAVSKGKPATGHPYLTKKGIGPNGVLQAGGKLMIPIKDKNGTLMSLQFIDAAGSKLFLTGGRVQGGMYRIGGRPTQTICICEGFATACSIHQATKLVTVCAFNAGNLKPVAEAMRATNPDVIIAICADDDHKRDGNPGLSHARAAAAAVGGHVAVPTFGAERTDSQTDFNDMHAALGLDEVRHCVINALTFKFKPLVASMEERLATNAGRPMPDNVAAKPVDIPDRHVNQPKADPAMLYGLVGDVAKVAARGNEVNPIAVAASLMVFLSAMFGRDVYLPIGNTWHHVLVFFLHVGRSGVGRKGDAMGLLRRIIRLIQDKAQADPDFDVIAQVHTGGLSSREGLVTKIHDGIGNEEAKGYIPPVIDKRLMILETEFSNVLHQARRDGNTLSGALRDMWDGQTIAPATKMAPVSATDPHVAVSGAITPSELRDLMGDRDMSNGFANRFLILFAERTSLVPFPEAASRDEVERLAGLIVDVIRFAKGGYPGSKDSRAAVLTAKARERYAALYRGELNDTSDGMPITALLERRAPYLLRIAMLFALTDKTLDVDVHHIDAALAWIRYWRESVRYIFAMSLDNERQAEVSEIGSKLLTFLQGKPDGATRSALMTECFKGHTTAEKLDAAIDELLSRSPPAIDLETRPPANPPGRATKVYRLSPAKDAKPAKSEQRRGSAESSRPAKDANSRSIDSSTGIDSSQTSPPAKLPATRMDASPSHLSHGSQAETDVACLDDRDTDEVTL